jgi:hypothetical protein
MTTGDRFQEYVTAALAFVLVGGLVALAIYGAVVGRAVTIPEWLRDMAVAAAFYYFGSRNGSTKLNGNVSKLADAASLLAAQQMTPAGPPPKPGA